MKKLQYALYRQKYLKAPYLPLRKPVDLMLELSSHCNQSCKYCYHHDKKNLPFDTGFMDKALAIHLIDQAAEMGVHSIKYNFRGESTMHPNYGEILEHAEAKAHGMTFIDRIANTNFKIPKTKRFEIFNGLCSLTKVKISFDSFNKAVFEKQRTGASFDLALENIDLFYNYPLKKLSKTKIVIQAVRTKLNENEDIYKIAKERWPDAEISIRDMVEGRIETDLSSIAVNKRDFINRKTCIQAHARMVVGFDGMVQVCCPDISSKLIIGDANRTPLKEIFNSQIAKDIRKLLKNKQIFDYDPCKNCSSYESFKDYIPPKDS